MTEGLFDSRDRDLVCRIVSSLQDVWCVEWVPLSEHPHAGDYVWSPSERRALLFTGERWI